MIEVISKRLYLAREDVFAKADLKSVTVIVNLSSNAKLIPQSEKAVNLRWDIGEEVEQGMFEALVRYCAAMMKAPSQTVLLVGFHDTVDLIAACILREYLGCKPEIALGILRTSRPKCLTKTALLETVNSYKIS